jgi:hypothetical protein
MDSEGMGATLGDVERVLTDTFKPSQHGAVRVQLARLEDAHLVTGDAARIKVAALIVAAGRWDDLVEAAELGLTDWRDLLVAAFYANDLRGGTSQ